MSTSTHHPHVVEVPKWHFVLRILQIVLAVVTLGLAAYLSSAAFFVIPGFGMAIFTSIATLIITIYYLVSTQKVPGAYNYWAVMALDIFAVIFWLSTMSTLAYYASLIAGVAAVSDYYDYDYDNSYDAYYGVAVGLVGGTAAVAAVELVLFVVTLVTFSIAMARHRKSGAPAAPASHGTESYGMQQHKSGATMEVSPA